MAEHERMAMVSAGRNRFSMWILLPLVAAGGLLLASLGGCGGAVAPHGSGPETAGDSGLPSEPDDTITDNGEESEPPIPGGPPILDIADGRADEGDGVMLFTVTLSRPSAQQVSVSYTTNDDTATGGADYTTTEDELTFSPGATLEQSIAVPVLQDDLDESGGEQFTVTLEDPVNAELGRQAASGVIVDDDASADDHAPADDDAPADDHGDTRATATSITQGSPISGRLDSATDVDFFRLTATSTGTMFAATDTGRVGDRGYPASAVVRIESSGYTSTNSDSYDAASVDLGLEASVELYVRVSGASATGYDLAVWLLDRTESDTSFDIELRYLGTQPTSAQKNTIRAAADFWESAVTGDLARWIIINSGWKCEDDDPTVFGDVIDDLRIYIRLQSIDGPGGTIAIAGPCYRRAGGLPFIGDVSFDTADLTRIGTEGLRRVAIHEVAHVLGYGVSSQWNDLLVNSAVDYLADNPGAATLPDTHFAGSAAVSAFDELLDGAAYPGAKVPVENDTDRYGRGGLDAHWREAVFGNELLTAAISTNSQVSQPLSKVTIASLADLGYRVDLTRAESYSLPSASPSLLRAQAAQDELHLGDHIRRGPVMVAEMPE